jgi:hypothetical protein
MHTFTELCLVDAHMGNPTPMNPTIASCLKCHVCEGMAIPRTVISLSMCRTFNRGNSTNFVMKRPKMLSCHASGAHW